MTYKEYSNLMSKRRRAVSRKRSLLATIRMNKAWLTNVNSVRGKKRVQKIEEAERELATLVVPQKPEQPIGYEVLDEEGDFIGFYALDDKEYIMQDLLEAYGHTHFKLKAKPRHRDDKKRF